jgi:hypothetical protein
VFDATHPVDKLKRVEAELMVAREIFPIQAGSIPHRGTVKPACGFITT